MDLDAHAVSPILEQDHTLESTDSFVPLFRIDGPT
jgi:hypothetical protein